MSHKKTAADTPRPFPLHFQTARKSINPSPQPVGEVSLTQLEFQDECDINHQIAMYTRNRQPLPAAWPEDFDYDQVQDLNATYVDAIASIQAVEEAFAELPSAVRTRFENDPLKMAEFLQDVNNRDEAYSLGLINSLPEPSIPPAEQNSGGADAPPASPPKAGV